MRERQRKTQRGRECERDSRRQSPRESGEGRKLAKIIPRKGETHSGGLSKRNAAEGCLESKGADLEVNLVARTLTADKDLM